MLGIGCSASRPPPGPIVSPTGFVYELGIPPTETRASQTASLYIQQGRYERALELATEGLSEDSVNPIHHFLAGVANARLGNLQAADTFFDEAEAIYPAYELDTEPEREAAWGRAFNDGLDAYGEGDVERTIELWSNAIAIFDLRPEAHRNLASLFAAEGRRDEAIETYRAALEGLQHRPATRVLDEGEILGRERAANEMEEQLALLLLMDDRYAAAEPLLRRQFARDSTDIQVRSNLARSLEGMGRRDEAREIYADLLSEEGLASAQVFTLGASLFRAGDYPTAADAFRQLTELQPQSRDAWFNYVNALFAAEDWTTLADAGHSLLEVAPLGENAMLMTARAYLEMGDRERATAMLGEVDATPAFVDDLQLSRGGGTTTVEGNLIGNAAEPGTPLTLRFTFYLDAIALGEERVTVTAPSMGESRPFDVTISATASGYRYELVESEPD